MEAIKVNLIPNGIPQTCHASQYDEGRQIRLDLFDGFAPYAIQSGDTFTLNVRKPDNHVVTETVTGTESNTYLIIETTEQMTAVTGKNLCEIRVENDGDNIGSLNFIMQVERDVIADGIPSESVIEDLEALVSEAVAVDLANYYTKSEVDNLVGGLIDDESAANNKTWSAEKIKAALAPLNEFPSDTYWSDNLLKGKLYRTFEGIRTDFDVSTLKGENGKTYYIKPNGNDSNTGTDSDHPLQKLSTALAKADVQTIIVMDGVYNIGRVGGSFAKGVNIIADENAHPIFITSRDKTWSATADRTNVYETTDSASSYYGVVKLDATDADGDYLHFTKVANLDEVESTENSWYSSGNTIYIHSESAPTKTYVIVSGVNLHATLSNGEKIYIEGCEFIGGNYGGVRVTNAGATRPTVLLKNCGFTDSPLGNSLYLQGCTSVIQNCYASHGSADGFNYHAVGEITPEAIEINCIGRNNGTVGNNTNNGSTSHEAAKIIRLNGEYFGNIGPNIADVDAGTLSFNYGVIAHDSNGSSTNKSGFQLQAGVMWNDTCSAYNNDYNYQAYLGGELRQHNCSGSVNLTGNGKATAY